MKAAEATAKLKALPDNLREGVAQPTAEAAVVAGRSAASGSGIPQAPALAPFLASRSDGKGEASFYLAEGSTGLVGAPSTSRIGGPASFGSSSAPQFHSPHRRQSWWYDAADGPSVAAAAESALERALDASD